MIAKVAVIGVVMSSSLLALQTSAPRGAGAPAAAAQSTTVQSALADAERRLLNGQSTAELLSAARPSLVQVVRKVPNAALSWQLEPSLALQLSDDEIFEFVTSRADSLVSCSLETYTKFSPGEPPPPGAANVRNLFWSADATGGAMTISQDCSELVDAKNATIWLATRSDFATALNFQRGFNKAIRSQRFSANVGSAPLVMQHLNYLKSEYGTPPQEEPLMRDVLGASVYSGMAATLQVFFVSQKGRPVPFFVAPLSQ